MKSTNHLRLFSGGLAAVLCVGLADLRAGAQAPAPSPPVITEAFVDAENATLTFNGAGFRAGFPVVFLGSRELPVRWALEASVATWLPELWPGTYRLSARWSDGSQADFYLTIGAVGPAGPEGARGPEGPRGMPGLAPAARGADFGDPSATAVPDAAAAETTPANPAGTTRYGTDALKDLTTGIGNTAFGQSALRRVTTGERNTAVGENGLLWASTGSANTTIGFRTMTGVEIGFGNTAVGSTAMQLGGWSASRNVAIGLRALRYVRGSHNIAIGSEAGLSNPAGSNNIYIGHKGVAGESGVIRIGAGATASTAGTHSHTYLAGRVITDGPFIGLAVDVSGDVSTMNGDVRTTNGDVVAGTVSLKDLATRVKALEDAAPSTSAN